MKLKKLNTSDTMESLQLRVRSSTVAMLEDYRKYYTETYGESIKASTLAETILREFMESDREFMSFRRNGQTAG